MRPALDFASVTQNKSKRHTQSPDTRKKQHLPLTTTTTTTTILRCTPHNALRHGGAAELCQLVREVGFVHVVAWHFNAIAETADADRFARHWYKHWQAKQPQGADSSSPMNDDETTKRHQRFKEEMRRLAQAELDDGRPITFGTVILTAHKPEL